MVTNSFFGSILGNLGDAGCRPKQENGRKLLEERNGFHRDKSILVNARLKENKIGTADTLPVLAHCGGDEREVNALENSGGEFRDRKVKSATTAANQSYNGEGKSGSTIRVSMKAFFRRSTISGCSLARSFCSARSASRS